VIESPTPGWLPADWWASRSLDARIAAALQANARVSYRDLARAVDSSESTVARRVKALVTSGAVRSTVVVDPIRCGRGFPVTVYFASPNSALRGIIGHLVEREDVRLAALLTGRYGVLAEFVVPRTEYLGTVLMDTLGELGGSFETHAEPVLREFKTSLDWGQSLVSGIPGSRLPLVDLEPLSEPLPLDPTDEALVALLRDNGRLSFAEVGQAMRLSESAVRRRLDGLVSSGRIHPVTLVEARLLGFQTQAFVWLNLTPGSLEEAARTLAGCLEVRYLAATVGEADLFFELVLPTQQDLYRFRTEVVGHLAGVTGMRVAINVRTFKRAFVPLRSGPDGEPGDPLADLGLPVPPAREGA
jgi:DNA-binding Lrp family transcriptional regulator